MMLRRVCFLCVGALLLAGAVEARSARADDDDAVAPAAPPLMARPTIMPHQYTLEECLALADRNFPNLWAARARLAFTHAQLEEARWTPWF
ncbi:MAG TPA: hypothetical protein VIY73_06675, partial [Polyangiaceae bacterium]